MIEGNSHYVYAKNLLISDIVIIHVFVILFNLQVTLFIKEPWQWNIANSYLDMDEMNVLGQKKDSFTKQLTNLRFWYAIMP